MVMVMRRPEGQREQARVAARVLEKRGCVVRTVRARAVDQVHEPRQRGVHDTVVRFEQHLDEK
eukprot:415658-Pleurochrysis_carterae.AAC.1